MFKRYFPLPSIDQLVNVRAGHELLSFIDTYSGYNRIPMFKLDEEHTSFITDHRLYFYKAMSSDLKNVEGTYKRLVNKIFKDPIGKTIEIYMDDMLVKSRVVGDHMAH